MCSSDLSDQDLVNLANNFILSSPPGELLEVVTDVRGLLPDESILNESAPNTFREWNTDQMLEVTPPGSSHQVLITKFGEISESEYLDPRGGQVILFDHIKQEVTGTRPLAGELDEELEPFRSQFEGSASQYLAETFENGACTVYGSQEDGTFVITVCFSSSQFNPKSLWTGRWRSHWVCKFKPGTEEVKISGNVRINVHLYEDGNVQLRSEFKKDLRSPCGPPAPCAQEALKEIGKAEQQYQLEIENLYATMGESTFKALRRVLPMTKTKIDWDKIYTYKVADKK